MNNTVNTKDGTDGPNEDVVICNAWYYAKERIVLAQSSHSVVCK